MTGTSGTERQTTKIPTEKERALLTVEVFAFEFAARLIYEGDAETIIAITELVDSILVVLDLEEHYDALLRAGQAQDRG